MNTIKLGNFTVYDPPVGVAGQNTFTMHTGAARYGVGRFCMLRSDYENLKGQGTATLTMSCPDPDGSGNTQSLSLTVQIAGQQPISSIVDDGDSATLVSVIVFDLRCKNVKPVQKAYNVQKDGFPYDENNGPQYFTSTLYKDSGSSSVPEEWTWTKLLTDLELSDPNWDDLPSWNPRNLIWDQVPIGRVIDEIAQSLFYVIGFDPHSNSQSGTAGLKAYAPGDLSDGNQSLLNDADDYQIGGTDSDRNSDRLPGTYRVSFQQYDPSGDDPFKTRVYTKDVSTQTGNSGRTEQLNVGEYWAVASAGSVFNQSELDEVANDIAQRATSFAENDISDAVFAGLWSFATDGNIRGIRWTSDSKGAKTYIRYNDARDFNPIDQLRHANEIAANQLITGLGNSAVSVGQSGRRFSMKPPQPQLHGKIACKGPCDDEDFTDNRYWAQLVVPAVGDSDYKITWEPVDDDFALCPGVGDDGGAGDSKKLKRVVTVTNLGEDGDKTHHLVAGRIVPIFWSFGKDGTIHYTTSGADESTTGAENCDSSSSNSSSSSSSQSSSSHCCDCIQIKIAGIHHDLHLQAHPAHTWAGDGWTLSLDGDKWFLGKEGEDNYTAQKDGRCPPTATSSWTQIGGRNPLEDIQCGCSSSSSSASSQSSKSASSASNSESQPSRSGSSDSNSASQPSNSGASVSGSASGASNTSGGSNGSGGGASGGGSNKSTAIVPASWSPTGYAALFIAESPEVRFDDVIVAKIQQRSCQLAIDPRFVEVCDPDSIVVCGCSSNKAISIGATVTRDKINLRFRRAAKGKIEVVIHLTGIRKGFKGMRFENRTHKQFEANERFINSAY